MTPLQVFVESVGLHAPGLNGWQHARTVLAAPHTYRAAPLLLPAMDALPAAERRRLGLAARLALAAAQDAVQQSCLDRTSLRTVFSSSAGDGDNCHHMLEALAQPERAMSPTRFHNAVHNAAAGYWHIGTRNRQPSTSLSAHDAGFGAALLEAVGQLCSSGHPCLLVAFDTPYGPPLHGVRSVAEPFGAALLLAAQRSATSLCSLTLALTGQPGKPMPTPSLETLRSQVPAARALPLLAALALQPQPQPQHLVVEYLPGLNLSLTLQP